MILALLLVPSVLACAVRSGPAEKLPQAQKISRELPVASEFGPGEGEMARVLSGARKEGKALVYSTLGVETRAAIAELFKERYGINAEFVLGKGGEISRKLITEMNAGLHLADLYLGGATTLVNEIKPAGLLENFEHLIFPEIKDGKYWFEGELRWMDKDKKILSFAGYPQDDLGINTDMVKEGELKTWEDIVQPRWKGKIVLNDPTVAGTALGWFSDITKEPWGMEFMRKLVKLEPVITRDQRQQVEWLAKGKYAIAIATKPDPVAEFKRAGAPVAILALGRVKLSTGSGQITLIKNAPHPNAARLFINLLLSQEGQTAYSRAMLVQSRRLDIPTDHLSPDEVRKPGVQYFMEDEETLLERPAKAKLAMEIFGPLMK